MKKLKIILYFSIIVYVFIITKNNIYKSYYNQDLTEIKGIITDIKIDENKTQLIVKSKEKVLINIYSNEIKLKLGDVVKITGKIKVPSQNTNFNTFDYNNFLKSKKIYWIMNADNIEKIKNNNNIMFTIKNYIIAKINNKYLYSFILGDNSYIDDEILESYRINGISHLFAVSGMQITLFASVLVFILKKIIKKESTINVIISLLLLFYMFLVNFTPSIIRAGIIFIILRFKKYNSKKLLVGLFFFLLLYNPYYIYDLGFKFSFIISFYLIHYKKLFNKSYLINLFLISVLAFLVSIPIQVNNFYEINIMSIIYNLIFVPFVTFIIFPSAILSFILPFFMPILEIMTKILELLSLFLSNISVNIIIPKIPLIIILFYYIMILRITYIKVLIIGLFLFFYSNLNYFISYPSITFLDVGQGDSILITLPFNQGNILIDTGGNILSEKKYIVKNITIPYLKSIGIKRLDYLIITHGDYDHIGEADIIIENFKVDNVLLNNYNNELEESLIKYSNQKNINIKNISKKRLIINDYIFNIINYKNSNENNDSLIVYTKINKYNILLMADATKNEESNIINEYNIGNIDILKIAHHGSNTSSSENFIEKVNPKYSIISAGRNNIYNHPHEKVLNTLHKNNSNVYMTSMSGSVKFKLLNKLKLITCQ